MSGKKGVNNPKIAPELKSYLEDESLLRFFSKTLHNNYTYALLSFPVKSVDPLACLEILSATNEFQFYWEKPNTDFAIAAGGSLKTLTASGNKRFSIIEKAFSEIQQQTTEYRALSHSYSGMHLFGGGSFFDTTAPDGDWNSFAPAAFTLPEWSVLKDGELSIITVGFKILKNSTSEDLFQKLVEGLNKISAIFDIGEDELPKTPDISQSFENIVSPVLKAKWITSVNEAKKLIRQNKFQKIVLARSLKIKIPPGLFSPTALIHKLRQKYANCYNFLIQFPGSGTFLGSSPERLVSFHQSYINTAALAGSISRGDTASEDLALANTLRSSKKDLQEHNFVIKAVKKGLLAFTEAIEQSKTPVIKKLTNVQHLYTPIRARLQSQSKRFSILQSLHPTPAVGGYPWQKAKPYLKYLENMERGWYAGPIGWMNTNGGGEFAVAIRSGLINNDFARFYAGCGIVENSDADAEWDETNLKLLPMLSALNND